MYIVVFPLAKYHSVLQFHLFRIFLLLTPVLSQVWPSIFGLDHCVMDHCAILFTAPQNKLYLFDGKKYWWRFVRGVFER